MRKVRQSPAFRKTALALAIAGAFHAAPGLAASATSTAREFQVNTYVTNFQARPSVAMDADGDFVVAWESYDQDGSGNEIYAQRYSASGIAQGDEFRVNTYTTSSQAGPAVAMDADGDFVVTWNSYGQDGSGYGVFAQRYNAAGEAQGDEFKVNTYTTITQTHAAIAMDDDGDFVVAWDSQNQDGNLAGVYAQRYNAAGEAQGGEFRANTTVTDDQRIPAVAMDADGDFVIVWDSFNQDVDDTLPTNGIYGQRYNASGVAQGAEFHVSTATYSEQRDAAIAMDDDGDFVVAWESKFQDGDGYGIYAQRFDASASPVGDEFSVNTYTSGNQRNVAVAMDADGDFAVTWDSVGQDGDVEGVVVALQDGSGDPEFVVNKRTTGSQQRPAIAMDADGDFVIAWESPDASEDGIFARGTQTVGTGEAAGGGGGATGWTLLLPLLGLGWMRRRRR